MGNIDSIAMGNPNSTDRWEIWKSRGLPVPAMWQEGLDSSPREVRRFEIGLTLTSPPPRNLKCEKASKTT